MGERINKDFYYLSVAETIAKRSTCIHKQYGAIIVKMMKLSPLVIPVAPEGMGTVVIDMLVLKMSSMEEISNRQLAELSMRNAMRSYQHPEKECFIAPCMCMDMI